MAILQASGVRRDSTYRLNISLERKRTIRSRIRLLRKKSRRRRRRGGRGRGRRQSWFVEMSMQVGELKPAGAEGSKAHRHAFAPGDASSIKQCVAGYLGWSVRVVFVFLLVSF